MKSDRSADLSLVRELTVDPIEQLDSQAAQLARGYQQHGIAAFVLRTNPDDPSVCFMGPNLPRARVAHMLRAAADSVEAGKLELQPRH